MLKIAKQLLKRFKKELGLKEWNIELFLEANLNDSVRYKQTEKIALIVINSKKDYNQIKDQIRHELLHIKYPHYTEEQILKIK